MTDRPLRATIGERLTVRASARVRTKGRSDGRLTYPQTRKEFVKAGVLRPREQEPILRVVHIPQGTYILRVKSD